MLSPAPRAELLLVALILGLMPQALCCRALRALKAQTTAPFKDSPQKTGRRLLIFDIKPHLVFSSPKLLYRIASRPVMVYDAACEPHSRRERMFRSDPDSTDYKSQTQIDNTESIPGYSYLSDESYPPAPESSSVMKALAESADLAREIREGTLSAFVGSGTEITGEASFKSGFRVDGTFSGRISSVEGTLVVATDGRVEASVAVAVAKIQGTLIGDIIATECIELARTANVTGNLQTPSLIIEPGAVFEGSCRMTSQEVISEPEPTSKPESAPGPSTASKPETAAERPMAAKAAVALEPETASKAQADAVSATDVASEQKTGAQNPPKVERKENALGKTKPTQARTNQVTDEESAKAIAR
jgi:cytoskeletal protein CcmA (bactofilin family)